jgi:hypothetical protein
MDFPFVEPMRRRRYLDRITAEYPKKEPMESNTTIKPVRPKLVRQNADTRQTKRITRQKSARESATHSLELLLRLREDGMPEENSQAIKDLQPLLCRTCQNVFGAVENTQNWRQPAEYGLVNIQRQWDLIKHSTPFTLYNTISRLLVGANNALLGVDPNAFGAIIARLSYIFSGPSSAIPNEEKVFEWRRVRKQAGHKQASPGDYIPPCRGSEDNFQKNMKIHAKDLPRREAKELKLHVAGFFDPLHEENLPVHHQAMTLWLLKEKIFRDRHHLPLDVISIISDLANDPNAATYAKKKTYPPMLTKEPEHVMPARRPATRGVIDRIQGQLYFTEQPAGKKAFELGNFAGSKPIIELMNEVDRSIKNKKFDKAIRNSLCKAAKELKKSLAGGDFPRYRSALQGLLATLPAEADTINEDSVAANGTGEHGESKFKKISKVASDLLSPRGKKK